MVYSIDNLRAQLAVIENELQKAKKQFKEVSSPDWQLAKEYGEQTRVNWLRTINQRLAHWKSARLKLVLIYRTWSK